MNLLRSNMNLLSYLVLILLTAHHTAGGKCDTCKSIVKKFKEGLKKTEKSNFGGGNTKWEEKSLGKYVFSETRFVEIQETLCADSKDCNYLLEEHEEILETWWFKEYGKNKDTDLHQYFCIDNAKVCCKDNTYGPKCKVCPGGETRPCSGNGQCDGAGTREGKGTCSCNSGYKGDLCDECKDGYYEESKNETDITCTVCHKACKLTCWEGGPKGCDECDSGWSSSEEEGCVDIDECDAETPPCEQNQYCENTDGSHLCNSCDEACDGCFASGPENCVKCKEGFFKDENESECKDVDECEAGNACQGEHELCVNTPGSFSCDCEDGYIKIDNACITKPKAEYVELYEDENYGGRVKYVTDSATELDEGFDKLTSSLKVNGEHKWTFYSEKNFAGTKLELNPGNYDLKSLKKIGNDNIRSIMKTDIIADPVEEESADTDNGDDDDDDDEDDTAEPTMPPLNLPHMEL